MRRRTTIACILLALPAVIGGCWGHGGPDCDELLTARDVEALCTASDVRVASHELDTDALRDLEPPARAGSVCWLERDELSRMELTVWTFGAPDEAQAFLARERETGAKIETGQHGISGDVRALGTHMISVEMRVERNEETFTVVEAISGAIAVKLATMSSPVTPPPMCERTGLEGLAERVAARLAAP